MARKMTDKRLTQQQKAALKHGGEGAVMAIREGQAFTGLARDEELSVRTELANKGQLEIITDTAIRLQVACNLYWDAFVKACMDGDLPKVDLYILRYGWLAGASLRAWAQVGQEDKRNPADITDLVNRYREGQEDASNS
jgi:hypothetical protein